MHSFNSSRLFAIHRHFSKFTKRSRMSQQPPRSTSNKCTPSNASEGAAWTTHRSHDHDHSQMKTSNPEDITRPTPVYYNAATKTIFPSTPIRPITPTYTPIALQDPVTVTEPRTLLVVLDLNGTLFYRAKNNKRNVTPRPHLQAFLDFIFEHCRVMVWSSAQPHSVEAMLSCGFGDHVPKLDRVWTRKDFRLSAHDYNQKVLTIKDLEFIWDAMKAETSAKKKSAISENDQNEPTEDIVFDQTNTVLIDDSFDKVQLQPYNGVQLLDFDEDLAKSGTDNELLKVRKYLEKLIYQKNVSAYMRVHPFDSNAPLDRDDLDVAKQNNNVKNTKEADELADLADRLEKSTL